MTTNDDGSKLRGLHETLYQLEVYLDEQQKLATAVGHRADAAVLERALHQAQWAHMQCHQLTGQGVLRCEQD